MQAFDGGSSVAWVGKSPNSSYFPINIEKTKQNISIPLS